MRITTAFAPSLHDAIGLGAEVSVRPPRTTGRSADTARCGLDRRAGGRP
jgi:hypothetical protein